jgi:ribosomal protein S12 methylthiotransferase
MTTDGTVPVRFHNADPAAAPLAAGTAPRGRVACITLGCPKNQVDSEAMLGLLHRAGHLTTADLDQAEVAIINTCSFIEAAREESIDTILEVAGRKGEGSLKAIVVAGCLAQRYGAELFRELPEIDAVVGTGALGDIGAVVADLLAGRPGGLHVGAPGAPVRDLGGRVLSTPGHYAYLKISEGCDHRCAFCIIPALRGPMRSRPRAELVAEASSLAAAGVRELNLISQDTTAYGGDLPGGRRNLVELLAELDQVPGLAWIRLIYTHPALWSDPLMEAVAGLERVVPYADVPIQHISDRMLTIMNRGISGRRVRQVLDRLRQRVPGIALRTTVIVGHPGETDADHRELLDFIAAFRFERLGVFGYSQEEDTPAGADPRQLPPAVIEERLERVAEVARAVALARHQELLDRTIEVMVDGLPEAGRTPARSSWDAPEIDGSVQVRGADAVPGTLLPVTVVACGPHDLVAVPAGPAAADTPPVDARRMRAVSSGADRASSTGDAACRGSGDASTSNLEVTG